VLGAQRSVRKLGVMYGTIDLGTTLGCVRNLFTSSLVLTDGTAMDVSNILESHAAKL
jgi:hypothetical protein